MDPEGPLIGQGLAGDPRPSSFNPLPKFLGITKSEKTKNQILMKALFHTLLACLVLSVSLA